MRNHSTWRTVWNPILRKRREGRDAMVSWTTRRAGRRLRLLAGIAGDVNDGAIFVQRGASTSSRSTRNILLFFGRQFAGAHTIQYSVRHDFLRHDLLLSVDDQLKNNCSLLQCFHRIFMNRIPRMGEREASPQIAQMGADRDWGATCPLGTLSRAGGKPQAQTLKLNNSAPRSGAVLRGFVFLQSGFHTETSVAVAPKDKSGLAGDGGVARRRNG